MDHTYSGRYTASTSAERTEGIYQYVCVIAELIRNHG